LRSLFKLVRSMFDKGDKNFKPSVFTNDPWASIPVLS
jgi:hypothetical protein